MDNNQDPHEQNESSYKKDCLKLEAALARMTLNERAIYEQRLRQLVSLKDL